MDKLVQCIKTYRPDLENLELNSVDYGSKAMKEICILKNLKSLKISHHNGSYNPELDFFYDLGNNCEYLENIVLGGMRYCPTSHKYRAAFNHFLGQRCQTLKSIDIDFNWKSDLFAQPNSPRVNLENLKHCKNLEELSVQIDGEDIAMLSEMSKLKRLVLNNSKNGIELIAGLKSMDLSNLNYLSFRSFSADFLQNLATIHFPVLERIYFHPRMYLPHCMKENTFMTLLKNTPKLKSIQFNGQTAHNLSNTFLFHVFKQSNVIVFYGDSLRQLEMETNFKNSDTEQFEKYQEMKMAFLKWFEKTDYI